MMKKTCYLTIILTIFNFLFCLSAEAVLVGNTNQATLVLTPQTGSYQVGQNFSVDLSVNTNGLAVNAIAAYINYNPNLFSVQNIDYTGSLFPLQWEHSTTSGMIKIGRSVSGANTVNSTNAKIATITLRGLANTSPTSDNFTFDFAAGDPTKSAVFLGGAQAGTYVLSGVYNARYTITGGTDTTPPIISSVNAIQITANSATIVWTTNEPSDSQVEYGPTTAYGSQTPLDSSMVTSHSVNLTGLLANTTYNYRVKSKDASGNLAVSQNYTFRTGSQTCTNKSLISSSVTPTSVAPGGSYTIVCDYGVTTNAINPQVGSGSCTFANFYGTAAHFSCTAGQTTGTFSNYCTLSNVAPDYYCAKTDKIANLTVTAVPATTTPSTADTIRPTVPTNFSAKGISSSQISLSWTASTDNVGVAGYKIERCRGSTCLDFVEIGTTQTTNYLDSGLSPRTTYRYRIRAFDAAGNYSFYSIMAMGSTLEETVSPQPTTTTTPTTTPPSSQPSGLLIPVFNKDLYFGVKDFQVEILQKFLAKDPSIYPEGKVTGYFGPATQRAVQRFQCKHKILCSGSPFVNGYGVVGPTTRAKLNQLYKPSQEELIAILKEQIRILQEKIAQLTAQINQILKQRGLSQ